jgi:hypothetical protein
VATNICIEGKTECRNERQEEGEDVSSYWMALKEKEKILQFDRGKPIFGELDLKQAMGLLQDRLRNG